MCWHFTSRLPCCQWRRQASVCCQLPWPAPPPSRPGRGQRWPPAGCSSLAPQPPPWWWPLRSEEWWGPPSRSWCCRKTLLWQSSSRRPPLGSWRPWWSPPLPVGSSSPGEHGQVSHWGSPSRWTSCWAPPRSHRYQRTPAPPPLPPARSSPSPRRPTCRAAEGTSWAPLQFAWRSLLYAGEWPLPRSARPPQRTWHSRHSQRGSQSPPRRWVDHWPGYRRWRSDVIHVK